MDRDLAVTDYLDAIFAAMRAFGAELQAARAWTARAAEARSPAWRMSFLGAAMAADARAGDRLEELQLRLSAFGREGTWPAPLDRLPERLATMAADLSAHRAELATAEAEAAPVGRA